MNFNSKIAAAGAVGLGAIYLVLGLATGHSARSEVPPDLSASATEAGLDVWKTAAALLSDKERAQVVDVRSPEEYARYHLPRAVNEPDAARLHELAVRGGPLIVVAAKDDVAQKLVAEIRARSKHASIHYLIDGPRAWYLAFELPVSMFAEASSPNGYEEALATLKDFWMKPEQGAKGQALEALQSLARMNFQPTLLKQSGKPKAAGGAKKKISGGCG
ncbi:MAG: rhodanese-like domain-containing protein [Deltaproteobacteria bacterium]|nr:rhodanese-like domain-containing protein [Deltaproteobacteria bacterium]